MGAVAEIGQVKFDVIVNLDKPGGNVISFDVPRNGVSMVAPIVLLTPQFSASICGVTLSPILGLLGSLVSVVATALGNLLLPVLQGAISSAITSAIQIPSVDVPDIPPFTIESGQIAIDYGINTLYGEAGTIRSSADWPMTSTLSAPTWRAGRSFMAPRDLPAYPSVPVLTPASNGLVNAQVAEVVGDSFLASLWYLVWPTIAAGTTSSTATPFFCNLVWPTEAPGDDCPFPPLLVPAPRNDPLGVVLATVFNDLFGGKYPSGWNLAIMIPPVTTTFNSTPAPLGSIAAASSAKVYITASTSGDDSQQLLATLTSPISSRINVPTFDAATGTIGDFALADLHVGDLNATFAPGVDHNTFVTDLLGQITALLNQPIADLISEVNKAIDAALPNIKLLIPPIQQAPLPTQDLHLDLTDAVLSAVGAAGGGAYLMGTANLDVSISPHA